MIDGFKNKAEFDQFADRYSALHAENIKLSGEEPAYFADHKVRQIRSVLNGCTIKTILDFGTGVGTSIPYLARYFAGAALTGVDISAQSLEIAEHNHTSLASFMVYDGARIPADEDQFDLVLAACVFHHIPSIDHDSALKEILRVLKPEGHFFVFEHNPLNPFTVYTVNACPFDENAVLIHSGQMRQRILAAGFPKAHANYCTFFPAALAGLRRFEKYLGWLPMGAQYYVHAMK